MVWRSWFTPRSSDRRSAVPPVRASLDFVPEAEVISQVAREEAGRTHQALKELGRTGDGIAGGGQWLAPLLQCFFPRISPRY